MEDIPLHWVREVLIYHSDTGIFRWAKSVSNRVRAGDVAGSLGSRGYLLIKLKGRSIQLHRLAWFMHYGEWPKHNIDHINRDRLDNSINNLRDVTQAENLKNSSQHDRFPKEAMLYAPY